MVTDEINVDTDKKHTDIGFCHTIVKLKDYSDVPIKKCENTCCCCLQFCLLFAVSKMSLFCTEINYSLVSSFNNKYLLKTIKRVSFYLKKYILHFLVQHSMPCGHYSATH